MSEAWPIPAESLIGRAVRVGAVEVATVTDLLATRGLAYVLGLEVRGRDGQRRFVPWVAAVVDRDAIRLASVFSLLSSSELALYLDQGRRIAERAAELTVEQDGVLARAPAGAGSGNGSAESTSRSTRSVQAAAKRSIP